MNYEETIHYLYNKLPLYSNIGKKAYKADLKNTLALCEYLGHPEKKIRTIHVAGTNGKGSTSHMLAAIFQEAGFKTGLYTSPHLYDFRERIKIDGQLVPESFVIEFVSKTEGITEQISPSFFELTFAMAIDYFAASNTDIAIIETGLGGRLDSTNVINPVLSVITNIGYDHMDILGESLEKIAFEKAGIIKHQVPVVIGELLAETKPVFTQKAAEESAEIFFAEEEFKIVSSKYHHEFLQVMVQTEKGLHQEQFTLDLNGNYQTKNLVTVLSAIKHCSIDVSQDTVKKALSNVRNLTGLYGRWQVIRRNPLIVLDVAHNGPGISSLLEQITRLQYNNLHIVIGMVKDKRIENVLAILPKNVNYYFTQAHIPRALDHHLLRKKAKPFGLTGNSYFNVNDAIQAAESDAAKDDVILVCGSVFVIAEVALAKEAVIN